MKKHFPDLWNPVTMVIGVICLLSFLFVWNAREFKCLYCSKFITDPESVPIINYWGEELGSAHQECFEWATRSTSSLRKEER